MLTTFTSNAVHKRRQGLMCRATRDGWGRGGRCGNYFDLGWLVSKLNTHAIVSVFQKYVHRTLPELEDRLCDYDLYEGKTLGVTAKWEPGAVSNSSEGSRLNLTVPSGSSENEPRRFVSDYPRSPLAPFLGN